jgi:hypothetical protein
VVEVYRPVVLCWVAGFGESRQVGSVQVGPALTEGVDVIFLCGRHDHVLEYLGVFVGL